MNGVPYNVQIAVDVDFRSYYFSKVESENVYNEDDNELLNYIQ